VSQPSHELANPSETASLLVVSRFRVGDAERPAFLGDAARAVEALSAQAGCLAASIGQSTDESGLIAIRTEWTGVGAYRRALSAFDVKVNAIPLLSAAIDEPSAYELVHRWTPEGLTVAPSGLAADAGAVGLGQAAAPSVPPVTS
jgi:quinol monooxygenase YgiN